MSKDCTKLAATEELAAAWYHPRRCRQRLRQPSARRARASASRWYNEISTLTSSASPSVLGTGVCEDLKFLLRQVKPTTEATPSAAVAPSDWNCEGVQGCGAAALPASLPPVLLSEAKSLLAEFWCALHRRNPPLAPRSRL